MHDRIFASSPGEHLVPSHHHHHVKVVIIVLFTFVQALSQVAGFDPVDARSVLLAHVMDHLEIFLVVTLARRQGFLRFQALDDFQGAEWVLILATDGLKLS